MSSFARLSTVFFALLTIYACGPKSDTASLDTAEAPAVALVDTREYKMQRGSLKCG